MKDIILKAIGEDKDENVDSVPESVFNYSYNMAKREMRAKIPQIVEEVGKAIDMLRDKFHDDTNCFYAIDEIVESLTVEKKSDEDNKGV